MTITTSGANPVTVEAISNTTTTSDSNRLFDINDSIVGKVDSNVTVDGFGLEFTSTLPGSTISVTNNGTVTTSQNNGDRALHIVPGAAGAFGTFTYSGSGNVTNTGNGGALLVDNQGAGNVDITISGTSTISGSATGAGIEASTGTGTAQVTIQSGGMVKGQVAVSFGGGVDTLDNSGTVQGAGFLSTGVGGSVATVTNSATISGTTTGVGVENVTLTNNSGATIETTGTTAAEAAVAAIVAVEALAAADITNQSGATIAATGQFGQVGVLVGQAGATGNATLHNAGTISGALDGVNTNTSGTTTIINSGSITATGSISITSRSGIRVNTATIENDQNGAISGGIGIVFRSGNAASTVFNDGTITGTGATPTAIQFSTGSSGNTLTLGTASVINGNVLGAGSDILQLGGTGSASFNVSNIGAAAQYQGFATFNKIDTSTWTLTGTGAQAWTVEQGTLQVDGTIGAATVQNGGTLDGNGTTGAVTVESGGTLAPGDAPGTITTGNLDLETGSALPIEIQGASAGVGGYDQVVVNGSVTLGGTLSTTLLNGFIPAIGETFEIINNDGNDAVNGTFAGLSEGATFTQGGITYSISYAGGTGNDVVLTVKNAPDDAVVTLNGLTGGNAVQGTAVSVTSVTDGGLPVSNITYQWQRDGVNISNATNAIYMPTEADEGHALTVNVGFTDAVNDVETTTGTAGTVAEMVGGDTVATLSGLTAGNAVEGTLVSVTNVTDGGQAVSGIKYQWQRDGVNINNANGATYMPTEADEGHALTVNVGFTDVNGISENGTGSAGTVADAADAVVTLSGLTSGNAVQGTAVTVTSVTDGGLPVSGATYTWKVGGSTVQSGASNSYTPIEADEGKALTVAVAFTDANSNSETATGNAGTIQDSADAVVTLGGLTGGNAVQGTAVSVTSVTDGALAVSNITYQWQRDGVNISNATNATYMPTEADEGHALTVSVGFTDHGNDAETATGTAGTVAEIAGGDTVVALSGLNGGDAVEGTAVTATVTDGGQSVTNATYTWKVAGSTVQSGSSNSYTPVGADDSKALTVDVAFTDSAGNAETGSASGGTVQEPPAPPPSGTTAAMITNRSSTGDYEIYDLGNNSVLAAHPLTNIAAPWHVVGLGGFNDGDTADMMLRNTATGSFEVVDVSNNKVGAPIVVAGVGLEWTVAGFGDFSSKANETDMLLRNSNNGNFELYDISNNVVTSATALGNLGLGLQWQVLGFGDFSGSPNETDMLMRNSNTQAIELFDIRNNQIAAPTTVGAVGSEWQFAGAGDFSGRPGETDLLMRNSNTGSFELYDFQHGVVTSATSPASVGLEWAVVGFGDISGNANETDMVLRNTNTGQFLLYDFSNNQVTGVHAIAAAGLEWTTDGIAPNVVQGIFDAPAASDPAPSLGGNGSQFMTSDPGPASFMASDPGPASFMTSDPGPASFMASDPGPASFMTSDPGPASFMASDPGPASFMTSDPGPAPFMTSDPGPSLFMGPGTLPLPQSLAADTSLFAAPIAGTVPLEYFGMPNTLQTHTA